MNEALKAEVLRAIQNSNAAVTIIIQLREGGSSEEAAALAAQLAEANIALEAALGGGAGGPPEAT